MHSQFLKARQTTVSLFVLATAVYVGWVASEFIVLEAAYRGFGVEHYVWTTSPSWAQIDDFRTSVQSYSISFVMQTYVWAKKLFGIAPTKLAYVHVFLQSFLMTVGAFALGRALAGKQAAVGILFTGVLLAGHLPGSNLGSYGHGLQSSLHPLYYGYANSFSMLALAAFFRGRHILSAAAFLLAGLSHLTIALYLAVFLGCGLLVDLLRIRNFRIVLPYVFAGAAISVWALPKILALRGTTNPVPFSDFLLASRTFSSHWNPIHLELLTRRFYAETAPLVFALLILFVSWPALDRLRVDATGQRIAAGIAGVSLLTILGVLFSDVWPMRFAVELCLQRASFVGTVVAAAVAVAFLWQIIEKGNVVESVFAVAALGRDCCSVDGHRGGSLVRHHYDQGLALR